VVQKNAFTRYNEETSGNPETGHALEGVSTCRQMKSYLETVRERVVIYDGAMGTQIQERNPSLDDFWGKENCSEVLVLSRPDIIKDIHAAYFQAGADVVETDTFGGTRSAPRSWPAR
jgi:methionine synthase I (cobalamin-dependent)